jgi:hypothetical protein
MIYVPLLTFPHEYVPSWRRFALCVAIFFCAVGFLRIASFTPFPVLGFPVFVVGGILGALVAFSGAMQPGIVVGARQRFVRLMIALAIFLALGILTMIGMRTKGSL